MDSRRHKIVVTGFGLASVALLISSACAQVTASPAMHESERPPIIGLHQAYTGYGTIDIIDDGTFIIRAGGENISADGDDSANIASEPIAFQIDPHKFVLVERDGLAGFERADTLPSIQRLAGAGAKVTTLSGSAMVAETPTRKAVYTISGEISFRFDERQNQIEVTAIDAESPSRSFALTACLGCKGQGDQRDKMDGISVDYLAAWVAFCEVACDGGSCSINCAKQAAKCFCRGATPVCECVPVSNSGQAP